MQSALHGRLSRFLCTRHKLSNLLLCTLIGHSLIWIHYIYVQYPREKSLLLERGTADCVVSGEWQ